MIMDVFKISDELKVKFEKQWDKFAVLFEWGCSGQSFTIDQFDGKMFNMLCDLGTALACAMLELETLRYFRMVRYTHAILPSNEKYCIGNIKEGTT